MTKFPFCTADNLINLTYDDLITAVVSNEPVRDKRTIRKVYNELIKEALVNALESLEENIDNIVKECNE